MASEQPDDRLATVGELCKLALAARRLGCRIVLAEGRSDLIDFIVFVGLDGPLFGRSGDNDTVLPRGAVASSWRKSGYPATNSAPRTPHLARAHRLRRRSSQR
jgi:hypothetical protein